MNTENPFDVLLLDTIGELVSAYAASDLAFVGGSLVPVGGTILGARGAGPAGDFRAAHVQRQGERGQPDRGGRAMQVATADELSRAVSELLSDPQRRAQTGAKAAQVVNDMRGATARTADMIDGYCNGSR